jgi:hypothetical protein
MRVFCVLGVMTTLCFTGTAGAQVQGRVAELLAELKTSGIDFPYGNRAHIKLRDANSLKKGIGELQELEKIRDNSPGAPFDLRSIDADIQNPELIEVFLKSLADFKGLKHLSLQVRKSPICRLNNWRCYRNSKA